MNAEKWDAVAQRFASGEQAPANGWDAWSEQAAIEASMIRDAIPEGVEILLEVGCGVGRLTPFLGLMFPVVIATDTSQRCREVTEKRCERRGNVLVFAPDDARNEECDCALIWNLYDEDWHRVAAIAHAHEAIERYPVVLFSTPTPTSTFTIPAGASITTGGEAAGAGPAWARIDR